MTEKVIISLIIGASIIVAASVGGVISTVNKNKDREFEQSTARKNEIKLETCLADAQYRYSATWESTCLENTGNKSCKLNPTVGNTYNKALEDMNDRCVKLYGK